MTGNDGAIHRDGERTGAGLGQLKCLGDGWDKDGENRGVERGLAGWQRCAISMRQLLVPSTPAGAGGVGSPQNLRLTWAL